MTPLDLEKFDLLQALDDHEREALSEVLERQQVGRGEILFEEGDPANGLLLIAEGRLRIKCLRTGDLGELGEGQTIGSASLAGPGPREATAIGAPSGACVYLLSCDAFQSLVRDEPQLAFKIVEAALRDLADAIREGLTPIVAAHG
ncbi:MAG: cyclic nucleotide-binding domain-containing protein [Deltaproteobacteria bacterium]|nr:MAG: cyclic nucleotide-binding domain-containing protein [Deltaproteobacteria bacterium]